MRGLGHHAAEGEIEFLIGLAGALPRFAPGNFGAQFEASRFARRETARGRIVTCRRDAACSRQLQQLLPPGERAGRCVCSRTGGLPRGPAACGMAGSLGFRREIYEASLRTAELSLLPKVRAASPEMLLIANGFSSREQIEILAGRQTLHLAEVLTSTLA